MSYAIEKFNAIRQCENGDATQHDFMLALGSLIAFLENADPNHRTPIGPILDRCYLAWPEVKVGCGKNQQIATGFADWLYSHAQAFEEASAIMRHKHMSRFTVDDKSQMDEMIIGSKGKVAAEYILQLKGNAKASRRAFKALLRDNPIEDLIGEPDNTTPVPVENDTALTAVA